MAPKFARTPTNLAAKQEMTDFMMSYEDGEAEAMVLASTFYKTLELMASRLMSDDGLTITLPLVKNHLDHFKVWPRLAIEYAKSGDQDPVWKYIYENQDNREVMYSIGCFIGSMARTVDLHKGLQRVGEMQKEGKMDAPKAILAANILMFMSDCKEILDKFA
jgi:hypothetical protein